MRVGVIVCGANGERGALMENVIREFAKKYMDKVIQMSSCTVAVTPLLISASGVDSNNLVSVNGCRNKCCDLILKNANISSKISVVMDDSVKRELGKCQSTSTFVFPEMTDQEAIDFATAIGKAVDDLRT